MQYVILVMNKWKSIDWLIDGLEEYLTKISYYKIWGRDAEEVGGIRGGGERGGGKEVREGEGEGGEGEGGEGGGTAAVP